MTTLVSQEVIQKIDYDQTVKNGKKVCNQYRPLVEKRLRQLDADFINSTSIVSFSGNKSRNNNMENNLIDRISWFEDQISNYINYILRIEEIHKNSGIFLKWKALYSLTDKEIAIKMNIAERTLRKYKNNAYYLMALYSNEVEFIYEKTYHFKLK